MLIQTARFSILPKRECAPAIFQSVSDNSLSGTCEYHTTPIIVALR